MVLVSGAAALTDSEKTTMEDYGKVTFTWTSSDPDFYTLTSDGVPDHDCAQCGTSQNYQYR